MLYIFFLIISTILTSCEYRTSTPLTDNTSGTADLYTVTDPVTDNAAVTSQGNDYPIVLVHGFLGWGRDEMGSFFGHYYWGGYDDLQEILKDAGHDCYTAAVGPFSSNWDRACELYAQIKGTTVDYGLAHSKKYGHKRFGKDFTGKALIGDWGTPGNNRKIHLIAHSQGGVTVRLFAQLLEQGFPDEKTADYSGQLPVSPLFTGSDGTKNLVCSISTMMSIHNGATMILGIDKLFPSGFVNILTTLIKKMGMDTTGTTNKIYDFKLEQFGISGRQKNESFAQYLARINTAVNSFINNNQKDICFWDDSPEGSRENNTWILAQNNIYYFSYAGLASHPSSSWYMRDNGEYYHLPDSDMSPISVATSVFAGAYTCNDSRYKGLLRAGDGDFYGMALKDRVVIDSSWWPNDGMANTIVQNGPWLYPDSYSGKKDTITGWDGNTIPAKGVWNYFGILQGIDHMDIIGMELSPYLKDQHPKNVISHIEDWYIEKAVFLKTLPQ